MIRFECDYAEGAHPSIMERLEQTNMEQTEGYGCDAYCIAARSMIAALCTNTAEGTDIAPEVHFLVGGTQTNKTLIAAALRPHQGVLTAETGHINVHETGAIESTGHKALALPSVEGKITASQIEACINGHRTDGNREHTVQPAMVYISHPTECGTLYSKAELTALSAVCRATRTRLYMDGARLGYGLAAQDADLTICDIAHLCDAFSIGGTKVGALFGEALVITDKELQTDFRYLIKQQGGMLAKGRLLGIQFQTLFENGLYFDIARHAVRQAIRIRESFQANGVRLLYDSPTNQQFPILTKEQIASLSTAGFAFERWQDVSSTETAVRFCTSWATCEDDVTQLLACIEQI